MRRVHLALSLRVTLASVLALVAAQLASLPLPLWSVLTAVIVTQMSVGRSLQTTGNYLLGTLGGAVYGGAISVLIPHQSEPALLAVLVLAVAPLAAIAATRANLNVVPITAIIVLLVPTFTHSSPLDSAIYRVLEVALGAVIGLGVSFLVLPSSAHRLVRQAAARTLELMAPALRLLLGGLYKGLSNAELYPLQDGIGVALAEINTVGGEAERERAAHLSAEPDTGPLLRTLLRLRHDLVMLGRTAGAPLPETLGARLEPRLAAIATTASEFLRASGAALLARQGPPSHDAYVQALEAYSGEVARARDEGLTRALPGDAAERLFAVGFALEQMHENLHDLGRVVAEWSPATGRAGTA